MVSSTNNKISHLVASQAPFFVRNDHAKFVDFVEAYYRYLEQSGETLNRIRNLENYYDVDTSEEPFLTQIYAEYIKLVPRTALIDKPLLVKHVKDFYRARGTEKAIRFLIQILFNKSSSFYYPKQDILRASDGKWYIQRSIRVGNVYVNNVANGTTQTLNHFLSKTITGTTSGTTAIVEGIDLFYRLGVLIQEVSLSSISGDFESGEQIYTTFDENGESHFLKANIRSGEIVQTTIVEGGSGYSAGDTIPIVGDGTGAVIKIGDVTTGNILAITVIGGGAGFKNGDNVLITSDTGTGATANVLAINPSEAIHPNTYNIISSIIALVANTQMNNEPYTTLNNSNANVHIQNACSTFNYGPTGPVETIRLITSGDNYLEVPNFDIDANSRIRNLGILGRMNIISGGADYVAGDWIQFWGGLGSGANAIVKAVDGDGAITNVMFTLVTGHHIGGSGWTMSTLPTCNVVSGTGSGANIAVTAILGDGEELFGGTSTIGEITRVDIVDGGTNFTDNPILDLTDLGNGDANVLATIIRGIRTYPGRFLNDDGHLSGYNFLEDRDYYQNYSYVVRTEENLTNYRKAALNLTHPAGTRMFGQHLHEAIVANSAEATAFGVSNHTIFVTGTWSSVQLGPANSNVTVTYIAHGLVATDNVYLEFSSGDTINISNGLFMVVTANANSFFILHPNVSNSSGDAFLGRIVYK